MSLSVTLTACVTTTASKGKTNTASFCQVAEPIYWSSKDTDETIKQVKEHNAVGVQICNWSKGK